VRDRGQIVEGNGGEISMAIPRSSGTAKYKKKANPGKTRLRAAECDQSNWKALVSRLAGERRDRKGLVGGNEKENRLERENLGGKKSQTRGKRK